MRLDKYLVEIGMYPSRNKAQEAIKNGYVQVNKKLEKASYEVEKDDHITTTQTKQYVSRAAYKLLAMIENFNIDFKGKTVLDVGASTGGFTEVLLDHEVKHVVAIDVGSHQLHPTLRSNQKVTVMEQTNILDVKKDDLPKIDAIVMDVSFVSIKKIIPHLREFSKIMYVLIKPQFETGGKHLHKGIVKSESVKQQVLTDMRRFLLTIHCSLEEVLPSPTIGKDGNQEYIAKIVVQ